MKSIILLCAASVFFFSCQKKEAATSAIEKPNIVLILADDLGYGDISSYNPQANLSTPASSRN